MIGYVFVISSVLLYAVLSPILKKVSGDVSPWTTIAIAMTVLTVIAYIMSFLTEDLKQFVWKDNKLNIMYLVLVGGINALAFYLGVRAYGYMPLWQQSMFGLLGPVITGIFAFYILGEPMSWKLFIGLAIVSIGLFIGVYDFGAGG